LDLKLAELIKSKSPAEPCKILLRLITISILYQYNTRVETMPKAKYRGLTLQRELIDRIEEYIKTHPERGYKSLADFVTEAVRKRCEELKILVPKPEPPPLEHFNINEDHVTVIDHRARMLADVYFKGNRVFCELCKAENCEHVKYALNIPKVQQLLRKKGWIIEEGEITQKPY